MTALDALRARISTAECAAALVFNPVNIRYLTGYHSNAYSRPLTLIVPVHGDPVFLVPRLEAQQARVLTGVQDVRDYVEWGDGARAGGAPEAEWGALLADVLRSTQGRIAVEEGSLTPSRAGLVDKVALHERAVDATGWIDAMRVIKSPREIDNHRRAAALAGVGLDAALEAVERAESEREIYAAAFQAML
ncbi:MAG: aminopeptidase P family N-terminal domain-containing protein, partial [Chloroflexi bacterium]|nr:aminopeptidase P family N-terminal domain-containing protein [Chloroflexota bacterium]